MLQHLTVKNLLRSTLLILAALAVAPLAVRAWDSWRELRTDQNILAVADASADAFQVMINIRSDRLAVPRSWKDPEPIRPDVTTYIKGMQDAEMRAFRSLTARLEDIAFDGQARLLPELRQTLDSMTRLQNEFWDGATKPIASRRPGLDEEYLKEGVALQATLENVSTRLFTSIRHLDATVDQLMTVKQLAWLARDSAGDASVAISRGLAAGSLPAAAIRKYDADFGSSLGVWRGIESILAGSEVPAALSQAISQAKQVYFGAEFTTARENMLAILTSGVKPTMTANEWAMFVVPKLSTMLGVAEAALTATKDKAKELAHDDLVSLITNTLLLLLVAAGATAAIIVVNRRVVQPLHILRDAMGRLATGTLTEAIPFPGRNDEIGALAGTLHVFQDQALAKSRLEQTERESRSHAEQRQRMIEAEIRKFDDGAKSALGSLTDGATSMGGAAVEMEAVSSRTNQGIQTVAEAARQTSHSVTSIAAATEQLSGSINEIGRHVSHATGITGRAVDETRRTDTTVRGLAESASKIGEVVKLINDIAGRTNLLALNATIEAARAGEAGRGFAVVASEVKSLATQTAKATEDIARQITEVQNVTDETVQAIRRIATTIDEVNEVATSIAAGVEQQGASTQEIARNVQQAAERTREMSETIENVSRDAQITDTAARNVKSASVTVAADAVTLRQRVDTFLDGIRAA
jgi:methyl-accepting chemotaxis protein